MEVSLSFLLLNNSWLLQEVVIDVATNWVSWIFKLYYLSFSGHSMLTFEVKVDIHILPKSWRIVISVCLCISKWFKNIIGLQKDIFDSLNIILLGHICNLEYCACQVITIFFLPHLCNVPHDHLAGLCLSTSRLPCKHHLQYLQKISLLTYQK